MRREVLKVLAVADGQNLDGYDLHHTAEMQYGRQADAVFLLIGEVLDVVGRRLQGARDSDEHDEACSITECIGIVADVRTAVISGDSRLRRRRRRERSGQISAFREF